MSEGISYHEEINYIVPDEPAEIIIYGEPGSWKTSFIFDPENGATKLFKHVIHLDFDGNSKFLKSHRTSITFDKTSLPADLPPGYYHILAKQTVAGELPLKVNNIVSAFTHRSDSVLVVVDSATMLGNMATAYTLNTNAVNRKSAFVPNQNDWGVINGIQESIFANIKLRGASYVLVCHRKAQYDTQGNLVALLPSIQGDKSRNSITGSSGTILHFEIINGNRNITHRSLPGRKEIVKFESETTSGKITKFTDLKTILE